MRVNPSPDFNMACHKHGTLTMHLRPNILISAKMPANRLDSQAESKALEYSMSFRKEGTSALVPNKLGLFGRVPRPYID